MIKDEMAVPQNVRNEFDTSKINTKMNDVEEVNKESYYVDPIYVPEQTSTNVAAKVAAGVPYTPVKDEVLKEEQIDKKIAQAIAAAKASEEAPEETV